MLGEAVAQKIIMSHGPNFMQRVARLFGGKKPAKTQPIVETVDVPDLPNAIPTRQAKYQIGQVLRHRLFDFRGVVFDVDPIFANTDEWYESIPEEVRPSKDQPYYHLFAENERTHYVAYVSEQNLVPDEQDARVSHPDIAKMFELTDHGYVLKAAQRN
jgi:heat shock protein HspQ